MAPPPIPEEGRLRFFLHPRHWHRWLELGLLRAINLLPLPVMWVCGGFSGEFLYYIHGNRRHVATVNVRKCFPDWNPRDQRRLVKRHFRVFGQTLLDMGIAWWGSTARLRRLVGFNGREHYDRALADGKNVILRCRSCFCRQLPRGTGYEVMFKPP